MPVSAVTQATKVGLFVFYVAILYLCCAAAYKIRIYALINYGAALADGCIAWRARGVCERDRADHAVPVAGWLVGQFTRAAAGAAAGEALLAARGAAHPLTTRCPSDHPRLCDSRV